MNKLSSQQKKLVYLTGMVVLLIPIILLGRPDSKGALSKLRTEYKLGESTLGNVDPSSATMNLMLLGMRGIATDLLWLQANEQFDRKQWAQLRSTVDSIIMLQPHYLRVWEYQGWNLAFNVSAQWDGVADRYYWVKEGAKFYIQGSKRNRLYPELYWDVGNVVGNKIGRSDEWFYFRQFFLSDPDPRFEGQQDEELNPEAKDNYLVAKDHFIEANNKERENSQGGKRGQRRMMDALFRSYPGRSQFSYAYTRQREGKFDETTRIAWENALKIWTEEYGQERYDRGVGSDIWLEMSAQDLENQSKEDGVPLETKSRSLNQFRKVTNYVYWRVKADSEKDRLTLLAHLNIYNGQQDYGLGRTSAVYARPTGRGELALRLATLDDDQRETLSELLDRGRQVIRQGADASEEQRKVLLQVQAMAARLLFFEKEPIEIEQNLLNYLNGNVGRLIMKGDLLDEEQEEAFYKLLSQVRDETQKLPDLEDDPKKPQAERYHALNQKLMIGYLLSPDGEKLLEEVSPSEELLKVLQVFSDKTQEVLNTEFEKQAPTTGLMTDADIASLEVEGLDAEQISELVKELNRKEFIVLVSEAQAKLELGMRQYQAMILKFPDLAIEDLTKEEGLMAVTYYRKNFELTGQKVPYLYPLAALYAANQHAVPDLEMRFVREQARQ